MKVAIVGLTSPHARHFGKLLKEKDAEIAAVWDYEHSVADEFCREIGGHVADDIQQIADIGLDGVTVLSRPEDHAAHALPFIEGGVPVFIEDPMVTRREDLERIVEAAQEHRTPVMTPSALRCTSGHAPEDAVCGADCDCEAMVDTFLWMADTCEPPVPIEVIGEMLDV